MESSRLRKLRRILPIVLGLLPGDLRSQEALVLSGGGSRGLAHVGVVAGIDSLGRDPDVVVGVSMGAIVGSLYAAGYTSGEIWKIAASQDWSDLFMPMPVMLGASREIRLPTLHWAVDIGRFEFSRGLLPDWRINRRLAAYLFDAQARARGNFDRLPRRYRTLGANWNDGAPVVIAGGDLARAVRASMAEPGVFSPVILNNEILIDGGIGDYMPVGLARKLGVSTIIASDVIRSELSGKPRDPVGILQRALALMVIRAREDTTVPTYLVVPQVDPRQSSLLYPGNSEPVIRLGLDEVKRVVPPAASRSRSTRKPHAAPDSLKRLMIETTDPSLALLARSVFQPTAPAKYSSDRVIAALDRMYETGFTESVWPRVDSSDALTVHVDPRANASLDLGLGYDNDRGGRAWASAQRRLSDMGAPLEFELSGALTDTKQLVSIGGKRASLGMAPLAWTASASWQKTQARFVRSVDDVATREVRRSDVLVGAERRHVFPDWVLSATMHAEQISSAGRKEILYGPSLSIGAPEPGRIVGIPFGLLVEQRFGGWSYGRAAFRGSVDGDRGHFKLAAVADAAITNENAPADLLPSLGDDRAMPAMRWGEERGRARVVGGFDVAYPIILSGHVRLRARAGAAPLRLDDLDSSHAWVLGAELGGVWSLPMGSILVAGSVNGRGKSRIDIVAGQLF